MDIRAIFGKIDRNVEQEIITETRDIELLGI